MAVLPVILDLGTVDFFPNLILAFSDLEVDPPVNNAETSAIGHFLDVPSKNTYPFPTSTPEPR